jgi:16S rRNA (guanine966-N2)-methyltransferase
MSIKVAGGYLKGRILRTVSGHATRPTTGRVREAVFSILQHDLPGADVLDLFAGLGALAIEAVSRGANSAVMVEKKFQAAAVIKKNLEICGLNLRLIVADFKKGITILSSEGAAFDLIFADPPYGLIEPDKLYDLLVEFALFKPGGFLIMEHGGDHAPQSNTVIKTRRFGDSAITIFAYE